MKRKLLTGAALLLVLVSFTGTDKKLTERERALHALNRLAFGPRPGDVDRVVKDGVDVWIAQQLHPEAIPDREVDARLNAYPTLAMSDAEILDTYYRPILEARKEAKAAAKAGEEVDPKAMVAEMRKEIPVNQRPQRVVQELMAQRLIRAVDSDRQLNEVMVDFWFNHFNVFSGKEIDRFLLTSYERDAIRPHIWGRFEDLLMATAKSPAMLIYLDNARSVAAPENRPQRAQRFMAMRAPQKANRGGLNENYAREIMELHTLGVDGGYTQKDVTELARVFTGWSLARPQQGDASFVFRPNLHDAGAKTVLGIHFPAGGGMEEGERMIHILANSPATAHHIAYQLCQRLVADDPPPTLVNRVAKRFLDTRGDLRETVKAVINSPEFWEPQYYDAKVKSPFEYVASAVRAIGAHLDDPMPLSRSLQQMGEPLYGAQPPTGYSEKASAWINTGALLARLNFALALAANKMPGVHADVTSLIPAGTDKPVDALAVVLTGGEISDATRQTIRSRVGGDDNTQIPTVAALILGSPEFQRQ
ncbi:MAG TPA: DUF1800 domain-containing protein [Thermoanaerobaculia bacterium]|jgi:uncharacterized protein (DUF1800 family)|nr:DUF1800 domain-containing protein [Thermoanaerobaculia bacterium]